MKPNLLALLLLLSAAAKATVLIDSVKTFPGSSAAKYNRLEIGIATSFLIQPTPTFNPFDSADVNMFAVFTDPNGKRDTVNAFWMQGYTRCNTCTNNIVLAPGDTFYCSDGWRNLPENMNQTDSDAYLKEVANTLPQLQFIAV